MLKCRIIEITSREGHKLLLLGKSSFWPEIQQFTEVKLTVYICM